MTEYQTIQQQEKLNILLIGDYCVDEYQYGTIDRISPEAPVPVFKYKSSNTSLGMAANVEKNLMAFPVHITPFFGEPSRKIRVVEERSRQQIVRIDHDSQSKPLQYYEGLLDGFNCVIISDYDKGYVSYELIHEITSNAKCPVFIDTKKTNLVNFKEAFVKINELEYSRLVSKPKNLIVTKGHKGAEYNGKNFSSIPVEIVDVCGAGDTFLASLAFFYCTTRNIEHSIQQAVYSSSVTVKHFGVYAPSLKEIYEAQTNETKRSSR